MFSQDTQLIIMANQTTMRPPSFDTDSDAEEWLRSFERYSEFAEWNPRRKYRAFRNMLTGNAARWLENVVIEPNADADDIDVDMYDQLNDQFLVKFSISPTRISQLRLELNGILKKPTETVDHYLQRVERLCYKLGVEDDNSQVIHFIQGLPPAIKSHVMKMSPTTLEQAENAARAEELSRTLTSPPDIQTGPDIDLIAEKTL